MLRANTKEEIVNFDFEKLCLEWKERAPIFYAFLMTCATTTRKEIAPEWLPSIAVAGSILLKQRNSHRRYFSEGEKRRPEMRLLFAG